MKTFLKQHWKYIVICIAVVTLVRIFFPNYRVVSSSMEPTFTKGTIIYVNRYYYKFNEIQRGDIVLLSPQENIFTKGVWVHRVIAVEGDKVIIQKQRLKVNNDEVEYPAIRSKKDESLTVPKGKIYQKGDSPNTIYGLVDKNAVIGKVMFYF